MKEDKKVEEKKEPEKSKVKELNKETKYFLAAAIAVFAIVLYFLLFGFQASDEIELPTVEYEYFTFYQIGGLWQTEIQLDEQLYEAVFRFNPEQVENVTITGEFSGFEKTPIYVTFDPTVNRTHFSYMALATTELGLHLIRALNYTVEAACTKNETDACIDRPIIQCEKGKSVIELVPEGNANIKLDGSCVTLSGEKFELLRAVDRLLFQWYKIMK